MLLNKRIPIRFLFQKIRFDLLIIFAYSLFLVFIDQFHYLQDIEVPLFIHAILGTTISLLLAFRTNQAYERWWEARIIWGAIVNDSRTLIRQIDEFYNEDDKSEFIRAFTYRQIAWCYSLGRKLRNLSQDDILKNYFDDDEIVELQKYNNIPNYLLSLHSKAIRSAFIKKSFTDFQQVQLNDTLVRLCDSMGKSERIKTTVFPKTYSILLHFLIYVFATILPFGLEHHPVIIEFSLIVTMTSIFMLIEKIAIYMQDPFENKPTDIPVTSIANKIEQDLLEMIGEYKITSKEENKSFYVM